jgi:hypothetical protein
LLIKLAVTVGKNNKMSNIEQTLGIEKIFDAAEDFLPLLGTDYVEMYVGNAKQAAHYYKTAFGFQSFAYAGLQIGLCWSRNRTKRSHFLCIGAGQN